MGQNDVQFLASSFYTHQQNSGQEIPCQIPSNQQDPLQIGEIRDQDFTNSISDPFPFLDDRRNPRDGPLTSSATPATLASIFDRQVHNHGIHQHSPSAPKHPQLKSIQPSNPHGYPFDDIENHWVHHNTPVGSSSGDGSRDPFDDMDAWPLQMDQNDIDTWTMNLKCDNTANHPPPHKPDQSDNDNHRHDGSFPNQHQPAEEPDHVADLLTETDHRTQFPININIGADSWYQARACRLINDMMPHEEQEEELMQDIDLELVKFDQWFDANTGQTEAHVHNINLRLI